MAYTVLARRYRSATFDEVIGQEHIAQTLKKAIESGRIAHAYLFCGTRGTGKTSTARILAKCLNCEKSDKPTAQPCGKCNSCIAIARGDDIDVIEIDAASNTGVDNVRDIISNAQFRPARSRFKVYIIDEVHMLSKSAFNALLKTLEEPPEHVKFILATTEPEKVLPTILSRCQRYDFRNIPTREIAGHLKEIARKEKIKADEDALMLVAKAGAGSMRDSLSLLDRLLSVGEKELTVEMIEQLLGLPKSQLIFDLAESIGNADVKATLEKADGLISGGLSVDAFLAALIDHLRNLMILRACGIESKLVEVPGLSPKDLVSQADKFDPTTVVQSIAILEELRRHIRTSQAGRALLDATLARLALADQFAAISDLSAGITGGSADSLQKKKPEVGLALAPSPLPVEGWGEDEARQSFKSSIADTAPTATRAEIAEPPTPHPNPLPQGEREQPQEDEDEALPAVGRVWDGEKRSLAAIFKKQVISAPAAATRIETNVAPVNDSEYAGVWSRLLGRVREEAPPMAGFLLGSELVAIDDARALIRFPNPSAPKYFEANGRREKLSVWVSEAVGRDVGVAFEVAEGIVTSAVPAAAPTRPPQQAKRAVPAPPAIAEAPSGIPITQELRDELSKDPLIRAVMEQLGGQIVKVE